MRIAHLISSLSYGGAQTQLLLLCREFQERNHTVLVGSLKPGGEMSDNFQAAVDGFQSFDMSHALDCGVYFRIRKWLKDTKPDLVHTHLFKADFFGGKAAHSLGIPLISTKHAEDQYLRNAFVAFAAKSVAGHCFAVVAISEAVKSFLISVTHIEQQRIEVIRHGYPTIPRSKNVSHSQITRFGIVGRLVQQKGHQYLLEAFANARLNNDRMELLIYGTGELESKLKQISNRLKLENSVRFCGFVANADDIYNNIDVLILPSLSEGAGMVLLEAMSRAIPVIASSIGGIPEYLSEDCAILVPPGDSTLLAKAIERLSSNPDLRDRLGTNGRNRASLFRLDDTLIAHLNLYQRAIANVPHRIG